MGQDLESGKEADRRDARADLQLFREDLLPSRLVKDGEVESYKFGPGYCTIREGVKQERWNEWENEVMSSTSNERAEALTPLL